jgi:hypothetical protein
VELQLVLDQQNKVFEEITNSFPLIKDHDHAIESIHGATPTTFDPIGVPIRKQVRSKHLSHELLEVGVIRTSQSSFSTLVILVWEKDGLW